MSTEAQDQAGQAPAGSPPGQAPTTPPTLSLDDALAALEKVRKEAASHRTENAALRKAQADAEAATLTEAQKVSRERDTLKAELEAERQEKRDRINRYEVQIAAAKLGIVDPDAAVKLLDWDSVEYGDDGSPKNVDKVLASLLKARPYLAATGQAPAGPAPTNPARGNAKGPLTLDDIKRMTPEQINRDWERVSKVLAAG